MNTGLSARFSFLPAKEPIKTPVPTNDPDAAAGWVRLWPRVPRRPVPVSREAGPISEDGSRLFFRLAEAAMRSTVISASRKTSRACCAKAWRVRRVFGNASPAYKAKPKHKKRPAIVPAEKVSANLGCRNL